MRSLARILLFLNWLMTSDISTGISWALKKYYSLNKKSSIWSYFTACRLFVSQSVAREWPVCLWRRPDNSNQQTHAPRKYAPKSLASNDHRNCWWQYGCARALPGRFGCRRLVCNGQSWPQLLPESANLNRKRARLTQNAKSVWRNQRVTWILNFPFLFIYSRAALYLIELILWPMHAIFILFAL